MVVSSLSSQQHSPGDITEKPGLPGDPNLPAAITKFHLSLARQGRVSVSPPISHFRGVSLTGDLISLDSSSRERERERYIFKSGIEIYIEMGQLIHKQDLTVTHDQY